MKTSCVGQFSKKALPELRPGVMSQRLKCFKAQINEILMKRGLNQLL